MEWALICKVGWITYPRLPTYAFRHVYDDLRIVPEHGGGHGERVLKISTGSHHNIFSMLQGKIIVI
jgi:hypothetical protein